MTNHTIIEAWAEAARPILMDVAREGATITYQELWERIAATTTETPSGLWRSHIGTILGTVAELNRLNEEPLMVALVVLKTTGEVSGGYDYGVNARYGYIPANQSAHAAAERIKLYNWMAPTAVRQQPEAKD